MLTGLSQKALYFDCPPVVGVCGGSMGKGGQHVHELLMVGRALGAEPKFECHRGADCDAPLGDQGVSSGGDDGLCPAGEGTGAGQSNGSRQLLVSAPGGISGIEVEAIGLAEQADQLETPSSVDDLQQGGMNGLMQRFCPQYLRSPLCDFSIYKSKCLGYELKISKPRTFPLHFTPTIPNSTAFAVCAGAIPSEQLGRGGCRSRNVPALHRLLTYVGSQVLITQPLPKTHSSFMTST